MAKAALTQFSLAVLMAGLLTQASAYADETEAIFTRIDSNGDGVIQRTEFDIKSIEIFYIRDLNENIKLEPGEIRLSPDAFAEADTDSDGLLSGVEFLDAPFARFEAADANTDHGITWQEFERFTNQFVVD